MESLMNTLMVIERNRHNGAENYEHSEERRSYSNGFKPRQLKSRFGLLSLLNPQTRDGEPFHSETFKRFQRSNKALFVDASQLYFYGVSTRKVADIFEEVYGTNISPQFVSNAAKYLDDQTAAWEKAEEFTEYLKSKNHPKLAADLSEQIEHTLQYFSVVKNDKDKKKEAWHVASLETVLRKFSTSNHIERINRELRRRTDVVSIFPNEASLARLVGMLLVEVDKESQTGKKYVAFVD